MQEMSASSSQIYLFSLFYQAAFPPYLPSLPPSLLSYLRSSPAWRSRPPRGSCPSAA